VKEMMEDVQAEEKANKLVAIQKQVQTSQNDVICITMFVCLLVCLPACLFIVCQCHLFVVI
jgi:hypothetical protein